LYFFSCIVLTETSFEEIISERQAISRLNELDNLIEDARSRKAKGEPPMQLSHPFNSRVN